MIGGQVDWPVAAGTRGWFGQSSKLSITDYRGEIVKQGKKKQNKRKKKKTQKNKKKKKKIPKTGQRDRRISARDVSLSLIDFGDSVSGVRRWMGPR